MYHLQFKSLLREKGRSCIQYAAYISGSVLKDNRTGIIHNHLSKDEVCNSMIYLPENAPISLKNELAIASKNADTLNKFREKLWNSLEEREKNTHCLLGKCLDIAYPYEFDETDRKVCRDQIIKILTDKGYAVDIADHLKENNPHMQALISARTMDPEKTWADIKEIKGYLCRNHYGSRRIFRSIKDLKEYNKDAKYDFLKYSRIPVIDKKTGKQKISKKKNERLWQRKSISINPITSKEFLLNLRKSWEEIANERLPEGSRISCKSYMDLGINKIPQIYEGYWARKLGPDSDRVQYNIAIKEANEQLEQFQELYDSLEDEYNELYDEQFNSDDISTDAAIDLLLHNDDDSWFKDLKEEITEMENWGSDDFTFWKNTIDKNEYWLEHTDYGDNKNYFEHHGFNSAGLIDAVSGVCTYLRNNNYKDFKQNNHRHISLSGLSKRQREIEEEIEEYLKEISSTYSY
ncbi:MAG: MobA/MobL family protein [Erysipelotrichaceae bacterium]|nr:MobA/MobL family protein [Erysipelotrichaceae bacterium]